MADQRRIGPEDAAPIQRFKMRRLRFEALALRNGGFERARAAIKVENAARVAVELDLFPGDDLPEHALRIDGEAESQRGVAFRPRRQAFAKAPVDPGEQPPLECKRQARFPVAKHPRGKLFEDRPRRAPGQCVARRNDAGVAPARARRRQPVALENLDLAAVALQLIGGGHPDDPTTKNHNPHAVAPPCAAALRACPQVSVFPGVFTRRGRGAAATSRALSVGARQTPHDEFDLVVGEFAP